MTLSECLLACISLGMYGLTTHLLIICPAQPYFYFVQAHKLFKVSFEIVQAHEIRGLGIGVGRASLRNPSFYLAYRLTRLYPLVLVSFLAPFASLGILYYCWSTSIETHVKD